MKQVKYQIPNIITSMRIIGSIGLFFIKPLTAAFYIVYTLCGISDAIDGWAARKMKCTGELGSKLDSIADLLFYFAAIIRLMPIYIKRLPYVFWLGVAFVILVRLCAYAVAACKYHRFASMHTYANKITGFSIFLLPYLLPIKNFLIPCITIVLIAGIAGLEEFIIHLRSESYNPDVKTILNLKNKQ